MCVCLRVKDALYLAALWHSLISRCFFACMRTCHWSEMQRLCLSATDTLPGSAHPLDRPKDRPPGLRRAYTSRIHVTDLARLQIMMMSFICTFSTGKTRARGGAIHRVHACMHTQRGWYPRWQIPLLGSTEPGATTRSARPENPAQHVRISKCGTSPYECKHTTITAPA